jgi:hypothetical protein
LERESFDDLLILESGFLIPLGENSSQLENSTLASG